MTPHKTKTLALALPLLMLLAPSVGADEATHKATIDLVHLIMPTEAYGAMIDQASGQMLMAISQRGVAPPADAAARLKKVVMECAPYEEMVGWTADVYASRFKLSEIEDLATFYKTPTGKKAARLIPELMGEVGKKMGGLMMERMPAAMKKYGLGPDGSDQSHAPKGSGGPKK
jgi:hypothetical protein